MESKVETEDDIINNLAQLIIQEELNNKKQNNKVIGKANKQESHSSNYISVITQTPEQTGTCAQRR